MLLIRISCFVLCLRMRKLVLLSLPVGSWCWITGFQAVLPLPDCFNHFFCIQVQVEQCVSVFTRQTSNKHHWLCFRAEKLLCCLYMWHFLIKMFLLGVKTTVLLVAAVIIHIACFNSRTRTCCSGKDRRVKIIGRTKSGTEIYMDLKGRRYTMPK